MTITVEAFPKTGPLSKYAGRAEVLARADRVGRPWVLAVGDRVIKGYDLTDLDEIERARIQAEATAARSASRSPGVVTTHSTFTVDDWLVIEMDRLGASVAETPPANVPAATWARLFEGVARALNELHRRGLYHRDVKPANLLFDRDGSRLLVADFSISARRRRGRRPESDEEQPVQGSDRYVAPEAFAGRIGAAGDQYALAVTAMDVLGDKLPEGAAAVLRRATAQDPASRFRTIADFGIALRAALDPSSPHRVSSRLARVAPVWRHAWGPGACVAGVTFAALWLVPTQRPGPVDGLLVPLGLALATTVLARIALGRFGKRTRPRLALASRPWFVLAVFVAGLVLLSPILAVETSKIGSYAAKMALFSIAAWAVLGATPRDAGEWLIRLTRRWEGWRVKHRGHPLPWWGVRLAGLVVLASVATAPAALKQNLRTPEPGPERLIPLRVVAGARAALLSNDPAAACGYMRIPVDAGDHIVPCRDWAPLAAAWTRADLAHRHGPRFAPSDLRSLKFTYNSGSERHGTKVWSLHLDTLDGPYVGTFEWLDAKGSIWTIGVTRNPPTKDPLASETAGWMYDVVRSNDRWQITAVVVCAIATSDPCVTLSQLNAQRLAAALRHGPPGGP